MRARPMTRGGGKITIVIRPAAKHGPTRTGGQVRKFLDRAIRASDELAEYFAATIVE
jgi:hypothetical protein